MDRGRKRPDAAEQLPADKRACSSSSEFRPGPSSPSPAAPPPPPPLPPATSATLSEPADCDMESTSSGRSDRAADSTYGSCDDSDDDDYHGGGYAAARCCASKGKFHRILGALGDEAGPGAHLAALTELCEALSFCMEDSIGYFPVETAVPALVGLAGADANPDIVLLAVRALTYLCDSMPRSAEAVVRHGALPVLCTKLLAIEYLDVAEQCLQALEKISKKQPVQCLRAGVIMAVLSYIDFFSTSIQRVALSTVANVCKQLPLDSSSLVMECVPTLCNLLQYDDRKLVETVANCLIRIVDCFLGSSELLDELCKHGLIHKSLHLISADSRTSLGQTTYTGLISLLSKLAASSLVAVRTMFELNISSTLRGILAASDLSHGNPYSPFEDVHSNQLHEVLKLVNQLIPSVARDAEDIPLVLAKEKILADQPNFLLQFSKDIIPVSIQVVNSGTNVYVCYGCVSIVNNIASLSTRDMLFDLHKIANISSFLAGLLARKDHHVLISALKTVEILMQKLPDVFLSSLIKEGVIYAIDALVMQEKCCQSINQQSNDIQNSDYQMIARDISRCLCNAFHTFKPPSSEMKTCRVGNDVVTTLARHIRSTYFINEALNSEMGLTEILQKLRTFCAVLNDNVDKSLANEGSGQTEEYLSHILDQVMRELYGVETMSTFEFIESGLVRSLVHYLSNGKYLQGTLCDHDLSHHFLAVLKRFQTFACIALSKTSQGWENMLLALLVQKLQNALSSFDNFPVILSHNSKPRSAYSDIPVRRSTMLPCLKVRFLREEGETELQDYDIVLNVELSSSLGIIEGYLWPKVSSKDNGHRPESAAKHIATTETIESGSGCIEGRNLQEVHAHIMSEPSISSLSEGLASQGHTLSDASPKQRDLTAGRPLRFEIDATTSAGEEPVEGRTTSASSSYGGVQPKLSFSLHGKQLDWSVTLYQALLQEQISVDPDLVLGPKFWNEVYKVTYRRVGEQGKRDTQMPHDVLPSSVLRNATGFSWQKLSFFSSMLHAELPCKLDKSNPSYDILFMLKILEGLNRTSFYLLSDERIHAFAEGRITNYDELRVITSSVPQAEFMSSKLTDKLEQQMRDPLALSTGSMPLWCSQLMAACPFLFSFEARWKYFRLTAFGATAIQQNQMQHLNSNDISSVTERRSQSGTFARKKFKVNRSSILESAAKMMETHARSKAVLEVEYNEEVGTGLGPTMEFYTLVSHEFQKAGLGMWREDLILHAGSCKAGGFGFLVAPFGLFPRPWSTATSALSGVQFPEVIKKFVLLGQLVAKAIKDGRILDIPFSRAFYKVILEQELGIYDIQSFDPDLGRILLEFQALVTRKRLSESGSQVNLKAADLWYRNTRIEDLCLDFTLPGYSDYVLASENNGKMVNIVNLEEYVALAVDATIRSGISRQVEAFKSGFNEVFLLKSLQIFTEDELERLLCGERDTWHFTELVDHIKFDHGYTASSPPVLNLLEIIQEFESDQRRAFLQFVTGAPRLPPGGLAALNPKLTVVRKHCSSDVDIDLPSVMTCANYLKLPPYSSKERMKQRLLYAITEGQGSFHLS